jgi:voltage-gated potassium channel
VGGGAVNASVRRLILAVGVFGALVAIGSAGYLVIGHGRWRLGDCAYMTIITISTVGFFELREMSDVPGARALTVGLIVSGVGVLAYTQSNLTALFVEGVIGHALRRKRMQREIAKVSQHIVVTGAGGTGKHVIEELVATQTQFVAIDRDEQGVVAALTHDKDNLYVTLSARSLNAGARIVSKIVDDDAAPKIIKAGASAIVNPMLIGARRLASELIRPEVNEFLDQMVRDKDKNLRLEEVVVPPRSPFIGLMRQGRTDSTHDARPGGSDSRERSLVRVQPRPGLRHHRRHDAHSSRGDRRHREAPAARCRQLN